MYPHIGKLTRKNKSFSPHINGIAEFRNLNYNIMKYQICKPIKVRRLIIMSELTERVDEFLVSAKELVKWIGENGKEFPYTHRLERCVTGLHGAAIGASNGMAAPKRRAKITAQASEFRELMGFMVRTNVLTEIQSRPLLAECAFIESAFQKRGEVV
jgi:hypothetical protein